MLEWRLHDTTGVFDWVAGDSIAGPLGSLAGTRAVNVL